MTTCPSGVDYMHLVEHGRDYIEETYKRPLFERMLRAVLGIVLPRPLLFRASLFGARLARPFKDAFSGPLKAMLDMAPASLPPASRLDGKRLHPAGGHRKKRVVLMTGCAQKVLAPEINDATIRLLNRHGVEVVIPKATGCCGALPLHMGKEKDAQGFARANIRAWAQEMDGEGLDAIIINTSGCGTTVKDYGELFAHQSDKRLAEQAEQVADLACDITEFLSGIEMEPPKVKQALKVAYHSACSLQHGQQIREEPKALLRRAGFEVTDIPESHICCGSAGTYNLLQPELSAKLKARKISNIAKTDPDLVAAGNIGCIAQIASGMKLPVVHTVELLDWATGGPKPAALP